MAFVLLLLLGARNQATSDSAAHVKTTCEFLDMWSFCKGCVARILSRQPGRRRDHWLKIIERDEELDFAKINNHLHARQESPVTQFTKCRSIDFNSYNVLSAQLFRTTFTFIRLIHSATE